MLAFGLGQAGRLVPANGRRATARGRIGASSVDLAAAEPPHRTEQVEI